MSNLGHLGLEWERKKEERRQLIGKDDILRGAASTGKFIQSLVPTTPEEIGQELVDMYSSARIAKGNPWGTAAVHTGKKLIQNSPEVAKAVKVATDVASPYIKKGKEFLEKDWFENLPGYQGRQLATAGGPDSLNIPPKFQPQPLAIKGLSGSSLIKAKKNVKGFTGNVYEVSKKEIPQIKQQLGEWLNQQLKEKGNVKNINRQDFGTIIIDGEPREISRITNYLTGDGKLPLLPKVVTRKQAAFKRIQATQPPKNELNKLGRQLGLTTEQLNEYYQEAVAGFKGVREAASRHSKFKGEYHAGHFYPASRGGPTTRRGAGIESGIENVTKGNKLEGSINIYAAQKAGIPTTWAEDLKMWLRDRKGLPGPNYARDFSTEQRNIIESIRWDANLDEVEAIWKKKNLDRIPNADQMQAVAEEFKPKTTASGLKIGFDRH